MFCFQCQETAKNQGCTIAGVCGKKEPTANLQDLLIYVCKGISVYGDALRRKGTVDREAGRFLIRALFVTITNAAWDDDAIIEWIRGGLEVREGVAERARAAGAAPEALPDCAVWTASGKDEIAAKANSPEVRVNAMENEDVRSLRELLIIGTKGIAAYAEHAEVLGFEKDEIYASMMEGLASTTKELSVDDMVAMVMKTGENAVATMALLDEARHSIASIV